MLKSLLIHMWDRGKMFLKKMGGIILIGSVVVWALSAFPRQIDYSLDYDAERVKIESEYSIELATADETSRLTLLVAKDRALDELKRAQHAEQTEKSFMGHIGRFLAPVFAPLGIDWRGGIALVTGFVAKEIVVSTLGVLHQVEDTEAAGTLEKALKSNGMTTLSALSMMVFVLLYLPCLATVTTIKQETGSYKWMAFSIAYSTSIAWIMSFLVYQGGRLLGLG
jgi:ferrous iron transport protein B